MYQLLSFALALTAAPAAEQVKNPVITQAALYKNGLSAMVRTVALDADGDTMIGGIKPAVLGTFWIYTTSGVQIESIVNTTVTDKTEVMASSIPQILAMNKGKEVEIDFRGKSYTGKLIDSNTVVILEKDGNTQIFPMNEIGRAVIMGKANLTFEQMVQTRGLRVKSKGGGNLSLLSVEPGLDWSPQYWVDLTSDKQLKLTMRASVTNEVGDLENAEMSFVAGSPNMPFAGQYDPFTLIEIAAKYGRNMPGGSGGNEMRRGSQNSAPMAAQSDGMMDSPFETGDPSGDAVGELFFYKSKKVSMKNGEKGYIVLFETKADYITKYSLEIPEFAGNEEGQTWPTWQTINFKNTSGVPLTSAVATAYRDNNLVGQDELKYVPPAGDGKLRLARAVDIPARVVSNEQASDTIVVNGTTRQRVIRSSVITVQNLKKEAVDLEVTTSFAGEVMKSDMGAEVRKLAVRFTELNPTSNLTWKIKLKPGEKQSLSFSYRRIL